MDDSELAREKMWSRIYLIPVLQAEEDRDLVRRTLASQKMEKELLGAETKVYNSDRYVGGVMVFSNRKADTTQLRPTNICRHAVERHQVRRAWITPSQWQQRVNRLEFWSLSQRTLHTNIIHLDHLYFVAILPGAKVCLPLLSRDHSVRVNVCQNSVLWTITDNR